MKNFLLFWTANLIFFSHILLGAFYLIGWYFSEIQTIYFILMSLWIGSWIFLGYCPLSKLEFSLRRQYDESIDENREILQYYIEKIFKYKVPSKIIIKA